MQYYLAQIAQNQSMLNTFVIIIIIIPIIPITITITISTLNL